MLDLRSVTPTVCTLFGVVPPDTCEVNADSIVLKIAQSSFFDLPAERCLIYNPDAVGVSFFQRFPEKLRMFEKITPLRIETRSIFPPKTPICFASMYTGASPENHGIRKYERPVIKTDTLFDALLRVRKRVAIVAVKDSSLDIIFREREIDYFTEKYDSEVIDRAVNLLYDDRYDLLVVYNQEYDDMLHRTQPFSTECQQACDRYGERLERLAKAAKVGWKDKRHALLVAPDHGGHIDVETGRGDHGQDIPEDMNVYHFWGFDARKV